jgi:beta-glucanase (GH16 family)
MRTGSILAALLLPYILAAEPPASGSWRLAFSDDFNGSAVDTAKWNLRTGPRLWSDQRAANVSVKDGFLHIALRKEKAGDLDYTAGGIISKQAFRYGYYEARMRMPKGRGWHTSFWTMRNSAPSGLDDRYQEIDICEQDSIDHSSYSVNWHNYKPHSSFGYKRINGSDLSTEFHNYGAEFNAREVRFYFDGALVNTIDVSALPHHDQNIWLTSLASYLGKTQSVEDSVLPQEALVDWVRYYRREDEPAQRAVTPDFASMLQPVPESAKLIDPDYYIWCGAMVRGDDGKYHLYYSRWPRKLGHNAWVTNSEIAHAVGDTATGPFHHVGVALPPRGKQYWDGLCTHNPTILRAGDKYYLYYMGNTGDGVAMRDLNWTHRNNQRIGVAVADNPSGPWQRFDEPLIDVSADANTPDALVTSNPAIARRPDGGYLMIYKAVGKQRAMPFGGPVVHLTATSDSPTGPFTKQLRPIFTAPGVDFAAEDPFVWYDYSAQRYLAIVKDNKGDFTHAGKSLALWESADGFAWKLSAHPLVATPAVTWADGHQQKLNSLERPQLVFAPDGQAIVLLCAVDEDPSRPHSFNLRIPLKNP